MTTLQAQPRFREAIGLFAVGAYDDARPVLQELAAAANDDRELALLEALERVARAIPRLMNGLGVPHARALLELALEGLASLPHALADIDVARLRRETQRLFEMTAPGSPTPQWTELVPELRLLAPSASVATRAAEARAVARSQATQRLADLGVVVHELSPQGQAELLRRFVSTFVSPEAAPRLLARAQAVADITAEIDRWTHPESLVRGASRGCLPWLVGANRDVRLARFNPAIAIPPVEITASTIEEAWLASWPGVFADIPSLRALFVTVDYEVVRCDMRLVARSPYR